MQPLRYLGTNVAGKKAWDTKDVLDLCDKRRDLNKKRYEAEGAKEYREANRRIKKAMKKAMEDWIGAQCEELNKNNSKRAYQLVKHLLSRTKLGNVLLKKKRFSTYGQNIAQNCTTMRVVKTTQYWTAASP